MSGIEEAALILGIISGTITVVDALVKTYNESKDATGLPHAFRDVALALPLVSETLETVQARIATATATVDTGTDSNAINDNLRRTILPVVNSCKAKVEQLDSIFKHVIARAGSSRLERYVAIARAHGKGSVVEELMKGVQRDIELLSANHALGLATGEDVAKLERAIAHLATTPPSVPLPVFCELFPGARHYGSGAMNMHDGNGDFNVNCGSGSQFISKTMYFSGN